MTTKPTFTIDVDYYQKFLDDPGISDARKQELIETLWGVVCQFVMIGFNVHPVQQAQQSCAKDRAKALPDTQTDAPMPDSGLGSLVQAFAAACGRDAPNVKQEGENADA